ncbi:CDP-alcohol phosphatidyltransferase family protein [Desulforhabdus amnigena]|jgi:cardiolipin synthase|uniref:CDP-diacylglycerol--glycerol-3-phosphate 3-phosphatidyltransferase n=1 Tax=Desulforhabdus amnigena TaxID=40218 RepID=A0A9W6FTU1_9BACT|nr:CDP-alcohol phosphatidyltransferase family protein [Desulforhabdus amnigena]NLJ27050.1 CDP-alcohol phosphatidyltransferase family protein [Deltaproteobacteria bacterium]GLI34146.1 hypothetical protein DAMNIGENAA_15790 [Desulforhabdus amnigena]
MTIPNILTLGRILLTPLLIWLLLDGNLKQALFVFFIAGMTDGLDGLIARLFHQKSKLGAYLDPLADKLLLVSSFILLGHLGLVPDWLVIVTVSRDIMIVLGLMTLIFHEVSVEIRPSFFSKITTLMQLVTILAVMGSPYASLPEWGYSILFFATAFFSVGSGIHYILIGISLLETRRSNNEE